jgi:hypothetical protein
VAAGWVQMRCRECAAEVAAAARVCSRCGAPIVGQLPPVVVDTVVADTVVGAVSDAAGKAVPARVAEQAPPEPYVPGSGESLPAKLRLVLAGYLGIAFCLFATALACVASAVFVIFFGGALDGLDDGLDHATRGRFFVSAVVVCIATGVICIWIWGLFDAPPKRSRRSRRVAGFRGCSGGPAIHVRPRWWPRSVVDAQ